MFPLETGRYDVALQQERRWLVEQALPLVLAGVPSPIPTGPLVDMLARWLNTSKTADIAKLLMSLAPTYPQASHTGPTFKRFGRVNRGWLWLPLPQYVAPSPPVSSPSPALPPVSPALPDYHVNPHTPGTTEYRERAIANADNAELAAATRAGLSLEAFREREYGPVEAEPNGLEDLL